MFSWLGVIAGSYIISRARPDLGVFYALLPGETRLRLHSTRNVCIPRLGLESRIRDVLGAMDLCRGGSKASSV
jgi:hypothetical protein